jgi:glutamate synthase (NADPH/NADH) small chain
MTNERGFMEIPRKDPGYRAKAERVQDYRAVEVRLSDADLHDQAARCMDCGTPFCHGCGCPLRNVIPEMNDHAFNGRWQAAVDILLTTNCFPEFTGRICPAPCEGSCVLGINADPVTIRQIELTIAEKAFALGLIKATPPATRSGHKVAVVGSGPAGLASAHYLNHMGYSVVVYENMAKPGGILHYGIPEFKLEKWVVDRRIQLMKDEGVVFECGVEIGRDVSYRFLDGRFDAVVLTGGAREPRDIKVPGRELKGIHFAMPFLVQQNMRVGGEFIKPEDEILAAGCNVLVIGGGDTGSDCLGTSIRQGAKQVLQVEIMPKPPATRSPETPWPQWPNMLRESSSHKEGGSRRWCVTTKEFLGRDGHVRQVRCAEVDWVQPKGGGRPAPVEKPGSEFIVDADLVLLSMGFVGAGRNHMVEQLGIRLDDRGLIWRDGNGMTSLPGTFVAGDMTQGASLVVRAILDGTRVAGGVARYLGGKSPKGA